MKIKSRVWYWLAAASGTASLLYGMGIEGGAQLGSSISDSQFVTAPAAMAASSVITPAPKSRSIDRTGGAHEKQMSPPVLVTRTSPKGDGSLPPSPLMISHQKGFYK